MPKPVIGTCGGPGQPSCPPIPTARPLPAGVTNPDGVLSDRQVEEILEGLLIPNENAIYALAKEVAKARGIDE
jgi:hypothetical protein